MSAGGVVASIAVKSASGARASPVSALMPLVTIMAYVWRGSYGESLKLRTAIVWLHEYFVRPLLVTQPRPSSLPNDGPAVTSISLTVSGVAVL